MAQQLRTLPILPEDPDLILSTHMAAHNCSETPVPKDLTPSYRHACMHRQHIKINTSFLKIKHGKTFLQNKRNYPDGHLFIAANLPSHSTENETV